MKVVGWAMTALATTALLFVTAPAVQAEEVNMNLPLVGNHRIKFTIDSPCLVDIVNNPSTGKPVLSAHIQDMDAPTYMSLSTIMFPFNSVTMDWKNTTTGATGSVSNSNTGNIITVSDYDTGLGVVEGTVTYTRSLLPTLSGGSSVPLVSATHTVPFSVAVEHDEFCKAGDD